MFTSFRLDRNTVLAGLRQRENDYLPRGDSMILTFHMPITLSLPAGYWRHMK